MKDIAFGNMIRSIFATFNRQSPPKATLDHWQGKVSRVPDEAGPWITEHIEAMDRLPSNIPGAILDLNEQWRRSHPDKCASDSHANSACPDCCDNGVFYSWRWHPECNRYCRFVSFCAWCRPHALDRATRRKLEEDDGIARVMKPGERPAQVEEELNGISARLAQWNSEREHRGRRIDLARLIGEIGEAPQPASSPRAATSTT